MYPILPFIVKNRGSVKYLKYFISLSRQKGTVSKPPSSKIFAASSATPSKPHYHDSETASQSKLTKTDSVFLNPSDNKKTEENDATCNAISKEIKPHLKPVLKPDVTATVLENETIKEPESVKLLNTVKPLDLDWHKQVLNFQKLPSHYKSLSKFRLTGLVVLTTLAGYGMAPGTFDPITCMCMVVGTGLTSAAANAVNQVMEVPYDSQMARTKNRVLIRGALTPLHAATFALCSASIGLTTLFLGANTLTAVLGATNLVLYTSIYTPLKRFSIANTWLGSVVGAIPPLMGWAACMGTLNAGAVLMGAILYSWQFPHFNALSWNLRPDYSRAGYRMTSVINPDLCKRVALRHSIALLFLCSAAPYLELTTWTFAFDTLPLNCFLIYRAWQFYDKGDSESSRKLFRLSLIYLPILMLLMLVGKKHVIKKEDKPKSIYLQES